MGEQEMEQRLEEEVPAPFSKFRMGFLRQGGGPAQDKGKYQDYMRRRKAAERNILQRERMDLMRDTKMGKHLSGLEAMEESRARAAEQHEQDMMLDSRGPRYGRRSKAAPMPTVAAMMGGLPEIPAEPMRRKTPEVRIVDRADASADQQKEWQAAAPAGQVYKGFMKGSDGVVRPVYGEPWEDIEDRRMARLTGERETALAAHESARALMEEENAPWKPSVVDLPGGGKALMTSANSAVPYAGPESAPEPGEGPVVSKDGKFYRNPGETTWRPLKQEKETAEDPTTLLVRQKDMQKLEKLQGELTKHQEAMERGDKRFGLFNVRDRAKRVAQLQGEIAAIRKTHGMEEEAAAPEAVAEKTGGAPEKKGPEMAKAGPPTMDEAAAAKTVSPAEARKLKPGTVYRGTDGKLRRA
jgi:hypothetical protein